MSSVLSPLFGQTPVKGECMAESRVGLKEIAELAGMSVGNVSMVLRGLGNEARISAASQERILNAARQLNYKPNVYAKRLRMQKADKMIVAVFFASSRHVNVMGCFFSGIHDLLCNASPENKPEIVLYPYTKGRLAEEDELIHQGCFNGVLFMGMSWEDMKYLESLTISAPIVVFNRVSVHHHYVYADNGNVGQLAARIFCEMGLRRMCLVTGQTVTTAGAERREGFIHECEKLGLELPQEMILRVSSRYEGGNQAAAAILSAEKLPEAIFFSEDLMAVSAQHELLLHGVKIPEQVRIICYNGSNSELYTFPMLSTIQVPMEEMSRDCLALLQKAIQHTNCRQMNIVHKPILVLRESCEK